MTPCESCGELTRFPVYFENPYQIFCSRCAERRRAKGDIDIATAKNLADERRGQITIGGKGTGVYIGLD
jgi:hypothetical protein